MLRIVATTVAELVKKTNEALKVNSENLNNMILTRTSETEQKIIRRDLENEHLKLIGHNLDLIQCDKKTGWEISAFAKTTIIANWYKANKALADATISEAMDLTSNTYILSVGQKTSKCKLYLFSG